MKMRGSETVKEDFKTQIFDIFGTVDLEQLRAIAQKVQLIESEKPHNERGAGRKNSLTPQQLAEMLALHQQGMGATELAKKYGISGLASDGQPSLLGAEYLARRLSLEAVLAELDAPNGLRLVCLRHDQQLPPFELLEEGAAEVLARRSFAFRSQRLATAR